MSVIDPNIAALQTIVETLQATVSTLLDKQKYLIFYKNNAINQLAEQSGAINTLHDQVTNVNKVLNSPMEITQLNNKLTITPKK